MRRILLLVSAVALVMVAVAGNAWAAPVGPTSNEHNYDNNCGGLTSFEAIQVYGGDVIGDIFSDFGPGGPDEGIPPRTAANCSLLGEFPPGSP